jgi:hypothetical protein
MGTDEKDQEFGRRISSFLLKRCMGKKAQCYAVSQLHCCTVVPSNEQISSKVLPSVSLVAARGTTRIAFLKE